MLATTKICSNCKEEQPITGFVCDAGRPDGIYPRCKKCTRKYYLENSSRICSQSKQYRDANREAVRAMNRQWSFRRFFYLKASNLRIRKNGLSASHKELAQLWKFQRGLCPLSGRRLDRNSAQVDHIVPVTRGGTSTIENLRWVHRDVNYAKRDLFDTEFIALCQEITLVNLTKQGV